MRQTLSHPGLRGRLALRLMDLCGYATKPLDYRGFYNLTKRVGRLVDHRAEVTVALDDDARFRFLVADPYWNRLIHEGFEYEPEIHHFFSLLAGTPFSFLDGGANWGYWSIIASSRRVGAVETVAYEPMPAAFARLRANAAINGDRFRVQNKAIAGEAMQGIPMSVGDGAEASAVGASIAKAEHGEGAVLVDAVGIDEALSSLESGAPAVIKLDLEGVEVPVIRASRWIDDNDCLLLFEDHAKDPTSAATVAVLDKGWPVYFFHDDGALDRIADVQQAAALKTVRNRGYNFFGAHPGGVFDRMLAAKVRA